MSNNDVCVGQYSGTLFKLAISHSEITLCRSGILHSLHQLKACTWPVRLDQLNFFYSLHSKLLPCMNDRSTLIIECIMQIYSGQLSVMQALKYSIIDFTPQFLVGTTHTARLNPYCYVTGVTRNNSTSPVYSYNYMSNLYNAI